MFAINPQKSSSLTLAAGQFPKSLQETWHKADPTSQPVRKPTQFIQSSTTFDQLTNRNITTLVPAGRDSVYNSKDRNVPSFSPGTHLSSLFKNPTTTAAKVRKNYLNVMLYLHLKQCIINPPIDQWVNGSNLSINPNYYIKDT